MEGFFSSRHPSGCLGSVAQLVERSTENREVTGSTPVGATVPFPGFYWERDFFFASLFEATKIALTTIRLDPNRSVRFCTAIRCAVTTSKMFTHVLVREVISHTPRPFCRCTH